MNGSSGRLTMTRYIGQALVGVALLMLPGCRPSSSAKTAAKTAPAKLEIHPHEENLADVVLTSKAAERLGIQTAEVVQKRMAQDRRLAGELTIPVGESATVAAPVSGTIQLPKEGGLPQPGSAIEQGRVVFQFLPLLSPERFVPTAAERAQIANAQASLLALQMSADGEVQQFTEEVAAAKIALTRAEQLQRDRVGSARAVDDAKAQLAIADARLKVAHERHKLLEKFSAEIDKEQVSPIAIEAPLSGILRSLPVTAGQTVSAGTTLFEVINLDTLWIRVPVYVGLLNELQTDVPVAVRILGTTGDSPPLTASPVKAPPAADPLASTADLFYRLPNTGGEFRPGERVAVTIPLHSETDALIVPASAVLYDIHGNTWVYTQVAELKFRRVRVDVRRTADDSALLAQGPPVGTKVVVAGAAELFGTEFGTGK